jgi:hypothetical protein
MAACVLMTIPAMGPRKYIGPLLFVRAILSYVAVRIQSLTELVLRFGPVGPTIARCQRPDDRLRQLSGPAQRALLRPLALHQGAIQARRAFLVTGGRTRRFVVSSSVRAGRISAVVCDTPSSVSHRRSPPPSPTLTGSLVIALRLYLTCVRGGEHRGFCLYMRQGVRIGCDVGRMSSPT